MESLAMKPIIENQYTAARAYFLCIFGILVFESSIHLPTYIRSWYGRDRPFTKHLSTKSKLLSSVHRYLTLPSPFPLLTNHGPANLLRVTIFVGLNILWGWNKFEYSGDYRLYGWLTIANGGLALLIAARTNLFAIVGRIPSSTLLLYHRCIGRATFVHATLHFSLNTHLDIRTGQLSTAYSNRRIQIGVMGWLSLCILTVTSISFIRRRWFEAFYYPHALFLVFIVCASIHASHGPEFLLPGLLLWVADRVLRFIHNFSPVRVLSATQYTGNLTKFKVVGRKTTSPGQIAWIQVPGASLLNWHPFTIVAAPGDDEFAFAIRGLGGYTKLLQYVTAEKNNSQLGINQGEERGELSSPKGLIKMRVDGPYGVGGVQWGLRSIILLVAGGIGITPGMSIIMHIIKHAKLLASDERSAERLGDRKWHIHLLWTIKDRSHAKWFRDELQDLVDQASNPQVPVTLNINVHVTNAVVVTDSAPMPYLASSKSAISSEIHTLAEREDYQGPGTLVAGRPNFLECFNKLKALHPGQNADVSVCGPRSMINSVRKAAAKASVGKEGGLFFVSEEVFEL